MSGILQQLRLPFLAARWLVAAVILAVLLGGCPDGRDSHTPTTETGFRFGVRGYEDGTEDFVALTSSAEVVSLARSQLALPDSERTLHINGPIERGGAGHNLDWSWHFIPDAWVLTGSSAEVCDGIPWGVENNIDYWVDTVQVFCPWDSYVKEETSDFQ